MRVRGGERLFVWARLYVLRDVWSTPFENSYLCLRCRVREHLH